MINPDGLTNCIDHGIDIAVLGTKFQNLLTYETHIMEEPV